MNKKVLILVLVAMLALPVGWAAGQESGGKYQIVLSDGTAILIPDEWEFVEDAGTYVFSAGEDRYLAIYPPTVIASYGETFETPTDLLVYLYTDVLQSTIDETAITEREDGVEYPFADDGHEGVAAVIAWGDGQLFYLSYAALDDYETIAPVVEDILAQLPKGAAAAVQCFVSTDKSYGVPLRLGPGLNRGEITSLMPKDGEVAVLGKANAADGSLWWRVDKTIPDANELWVADTDVIKTGDCDRIGETSAQGIVAPAPGFVPAQPTPSGGGQTGGESGGGQTGTTPTDTSLVPANGIWYGSYTHEMLMSCQGGDTLRVPINLGYLEGNLRLTTSGGGTTVTLSDSGGTLVLTGGQGFYSVALPSSQANMYGMFYLHVAAPTSMSGELVVGFTDVPCSGTLPLTFTYLG